MKQKFCPLASHDKIRRIAKQIITASVVKFTSKKGKSSHRLHHFTINAAPREAKEEKIYNHALE